MDHVDAQHCGDGRAPQQHPHFYEQVEPMMLRTGGGVTVLVLRLVAHSLSPVVVYPFCVGLTPIGGGGNYGGCHPRVASVPAVLYVPVLLPS